MALTKNAEGVVRGQPNSEVTGSYSTLFLDRVAFPITHFSRLIYVVGRT